ncbi:MAG: type II toxin-antitoxin system HicB family antitoxin [Kiritimatiellae bacterium]|nr:type II toxin-antitoxin system HicB family antitoxin [Kiritimatiellia bacterium]
MSLSYTYWKSTDSWYVGYWNDYPDYSTQGRTLDELLSMLREIRALINDGTLTYNFAT